MRRSVLLPIAVAAWLLAAAAAGAQPVLTEDAADIKARIDARRRAALVPGNVGRLNLANQLRPIYRHELMYVRTASGLSREPLRKLRPEADAAYMAAIRELRKTLQADPGAEPDYRAAIREAVHSVARRHVGRADWDRLRADLPFREAARKAAGIDMLVSLFDRELLLTAPQREQIIAGLAEHWDDSWCDAIEMAFNTRPLRPPFPEEFVTAHLNEAQRALWHGIPILSGRLWGVVYDHGGDSNMEEQLGAVAPKLPEPPGPFRVGDPPPNWVVGRIAPPAPGAARRPVIAARPVVRIIRPVPAAILQIGDEPAEPPQRERLEGLRRAYRSIFDRQVFGTSETEETIRAKSEAALAERISEVARAGGIDATQKRKLLAAGHGDIKRFFDRVAQTRGDLLANVDQRARINEILKSTMPLVAERDLLLDARGPILERILKHTLTDDQREAIVRDAVDRRAFRVRADIEWMTVMIARSLGMTENRRRWLEALLLERTIVANQSNTPDDTLILFEMARVPEPDIRPIFDDLQWRALKGEFAAALRWEAQRAGANRFQRIILDLIND